MRNTQRKDLVALLLSVVLTVASASLAAWGYGITWHEVVAPGFFGFPVFLGMFVGAVGMPAYFIIRHIRRRQQS